MAERFMLPGITLSDPLSGLNSRERLRKEREDAAFIVSQQRDVHIYADPAAIAKIGNTFAGTDAIKGHRLIPYGGRDVDVVICARIDLDHPLYFPDNQYGSCADCGCDLQYRPSVPRDAPKACVCCTARRIREAGDG